MATTHTVSNDFAVDTYAVADQVDENFNDILAYLDDFDASNCKKSGTYIPVANITNLTSTQMAAAFFKDEDDMASDSATAVASQQSVKAYADAAPAAQMTPTSYAGEESVTFPNGFIFKQGTVARTGATTTVTFDTAFPTACTNGWACGGKAQDSFEVQVTAVSKTTMSVYTFNANSTPMRWFAMGY